MGLPVIRLDGDAIRLARLDLGLSQRSLAKAVGLSTKSMSDVETGHPGAAQDTLLPLQRLVDTLGVPLGQLIADDTPAHLTASGARAEDAGPDDMAALGGLLMSNRTNVATTDLADSLGWTLDRLRLAAAALDHHLRPLGMQVHSLRGGYRLRPGDGHRTKARMTLDRITSAEVGLSAPAAALIYRALAGSLSTQQVSAHERPRLAGLLRAGVLVDKQQSAVPGAALLDALNVPEDPACEAAASNAHGGRDHDPCVNEPEAAGVPGE